MVGLSLLVVWVGALQIMLDLGKDRDWFHRPLIVVLAIIAVVGFVAWLIWELTDEQPDRRPVAVQEPQLRVRHDRASAWAMRCSSPTSCCCRCGCRPSWAIPRPGPGWWRRRAASSRCSRRRSSASSRSTRACSPRRVPRLRRLLFPALALHAGCQLLGLTVPLLVQGIAMSMFFLPMLDDPRWTASRRRSCRRRPASRISRASPRAASPPRSITTFWDRREALHQSRLVEGTTDYSPIYRQATDQMQAYGMSPLQAAGSVMRTIDQPGLSALVARAVLDLRLDGGDRAAG